MTDNLKKLISVKTISWDETESWNTHSEGGITHDPVISAYSSVTLFGTVDGGDLDILGESWIRDQSTR